MLQRRVAGDGEEIAVRSNGGDWLIAWHPPITVPPGQAHGANAFCVTDDDGVVLISNDGERWGWPGGRPEGDESWEQTLRREVLEEACAIVSDARLLGFCRGACLTGEGHQGRNGTRRQSTAQVRVVSVQSDLSVETDPSAVPRSRCEYPFRGCAG
jgi:hypothetical protein